MPLFSIVIPTFNRAGLLRQALDSVYAQTYSDFEVIVVDDGSTDNSEKIALGFGPGVKFLRQQNAGPAAARNRGIQAALGAYVTFLDSDDLWFPWTLATFAGIINRENHPSWIMGAPFQFQEVDQLSSCRCDSLRFTVFQDYLASSLIDAWVPGCGVAIRRDVLQAVGGFLDRWINAEDSDLWLRLGASGKFVHLHAPCTLAYRCHPDSAVANNRKLWEGMQNLVAQEIAGAYPGGATRRVDRWRILCRHTRAASKTLSRAGWTRQACGLYRDSLNWNLRLGNWKYLFGFWSYALLNLARTAGRSPVAPKAL